MEISKITKKQRWLRPKPDASCTMPRTTVAGINSLYDEDFQRQSFWELTQGDLYREYEPTAHAIYTRNFSTFLPKYEWNEEKGQNEVVGQHKLWQSSVAIQKEFATNRAMHMFGNEIWMGSIDKDEATQNKVIRIKEHWEQSKMKEALIDFYECCCGLGDSAIYLYIENNQIEWKVFRYDKGDIVGEYRDEVTDETIGFRKFRYLERRAVELYHKDRVELWIEDENVTDPLSDYIKYDKRKGKLDDAGEYRLVKTTAIATSESCFCYFRRQDTVTGCVQKNIEDYESQVSDGLENQLFFVFPILFLKGLVMDLPEIGSKGMTLASKSDTGDAKLLSPPDISNIYTINLKNTMDAICDGAFNPRIRIADFSSQSDSAAKFQQAYFPVIIACKKDYATIKPFTNKLVRVFSQLVGLLEVDSTYGNVRINYMFTPFIPTNEAAFIDSLSKLVGSNIISQETAAGEVDYANPNEYQRLKNEGKVSTPEDRINEVAALSQATQPGTTELVVGESLQE